MASFAQSGGDKSPSKDSSSAAVSRRRPRPRIRSSSAALLLALKSGVDRQCEVSAGQVGVPPVTKTRRADAAVAVPHLLVFSDCVLSCSP
jgi:hypothetical protein